MTASRKFGTGQGKISASRGRIHTTIPAHRSATEENKATWGMGAIITNTDAPFNDAIDILEYSLPQSIRSACFVLYNVNSTPVLPTLISLMVSVDVKHHVYLLTYPCTSKHTELLLFFSSPNGIYAGISLGSVIGGSKSAVTDGCAVWRVHPPVGVQLHQAALKISVGLEEDAWCWRFKRVEQCSVPPAFDNTVLCSTLTFGILSCGGHIPKHVTGRLMNTVTKGG